MLENLSTIFFVVLYLLIALFIGYIASRKKSRESFLLADRNVGLFSMVATLVASFIGTGMIIVYTAFVYTYGISAMWIYVGYLIGFFIFGRFAIHLKELDNKYRFYTLSDYFLKKYGRRIATLSTIAIIVYFFGTMTNQFIGGTKILSQVSGWNYAVSLILIASVILIYLLMGGFKSVVKTDVFQFIVILLLPLLIILSLNLRISIDPQYLNIFNAGVVNIIAFLLLGILNNFIFADMWQRTYAARDVSVVKKAFPIAGILIFMFGLFFTYLGLLAKTAFTSIDPDLAGIFALTKLVPASLLGIVLATLFAAVMSSADTILFVLAVNISRDITNRKNNLTEKQEIRVTRLSLIAFAMLGIFLALVFPDMVRLLIVYTSIGLSFVPSIVFSWLSKKPSKQAMTLSFILPTIFVLVSSIGFGFINPAMGLISIILSFVVYIISSFFFKS